MAVKGSTGGGRTGKSRAGKTKRTKARGSVDTRGRAKNKGRSRSTSSSKTSTRKTAGRKKSVAAKSRRSTRTAKSNSKSSFSARATRWVAYWSAVAALWASFIIAGFIGYYALTMPDPHLVGVAKKSPNVKILGANGTVLSDQGSKWTHVYLEDLPSHVVDAVLATEDRRFYSHIGIDFVGLARALVINWRSGRVVQGGSTITQQLAKNLFLNPRRTFGRKLREVSMALWLETAMTKNEILELYLNRVYFGAGAYGIGEASQKYFGKGAETLSLGEAAVLAGLLKAPSRYAPSHNSDAAKARARVVVNNMVASGKVSKARGAKALKQPLRLSSAIRHAGDYDYAVDWVRQVLPELVGRIEQDVVVRTTIDPRLQAHAQNSVGSVMAGASEMVSAGQAAAVVLGADGAVRALVGGRSYAQSQFNRAVHAKRQPGSAFKPFVYLAALEVGWKPNSMVEDVPLQVGKWQPRNASGDYEGQMTLRTSLVKSVNTVPVWLTMNMGLSRVIRTAKRLGVTSHLRSDASLALGTSEVSLLELTSAYAPFANGGLRASPFIIQSVKAANGKHLYKRERAARVRVIDPQVSASMSDMMRAVVGWGTGKAAQLPGHRVAGKTGTSQGFRDAWFVGFTERYTGGVWVGNDNGRPMEEVSGGGLPSKIWRKIMMGAYKKPKSIVRKKQSSPKRATARQALFGEDVTNSIEELLAKQ